MSTFTSRTVNQGIMMLFDRSRESSVLEHRVINHLQYCHAKAIPEILLAEDTGPIWIPRVRIEVVTITEDHEHPC